MAGWRPIEFVCFSKKIRTGRSFSSTTLTVSLARFHGFDGRTKGDVVREICIRHHTTGLDGWSHGAIHEVDQCVEQLWINFVKAWLWMNNISSAGPGQSRTPNVHTHIALLMSKCPFVVLMSKCPFVVHFKIQATFEHKQHRVKWYTLYLYLHR